MAGENKIYICPSCGGRVEWAPSQQKIVCPYCGSQYDPGFFEQQEQQLNEQLDQQHYEKGEDAAEHFSYAGQDLSDCDTPAGSVVNM